MTDEELAKEYRKSLKQRLIDEDDFERLEMFDENVEEAFLAGLKAGRPQWHDLEKDPTDLPKEHKLYLCAIKSNGNSICYFNGLHWENKYSMGDFGHCVETVIAWCEIPTFDKE